MSSRQLTTSTHLQELRQILRDAGNDRLAEDKLHEFVQHEVAKRATEAKNTFLATVSHEIRTPMNGVLGTLELLLETDLTPEQRRAAEQGRTSAEALSTIINRILDFARIEAGVITLANVPFDLPGVIDRVVRLFRLGAFEKGIELKHHVDAGLPGMVRHDPGRLRQVLTNLVDNAIKFTEEGEVVLTASPETMDDAEVAVRFTIRDTGIGIPDDKLDVVSTPFRQADSSSTRSHGGTGLGLAISHRLVRLLGGELEVSSQVGRGTELTFLLQCPIESKRSGPGAATDTLNGKSVLVVGENELSRQVIRETLVSSGAVVNEAGSTEVAIRVLGDLAARGRRIELAIIDGYVSGHDWADVARAIQSEAALSDTRLMILASVGQLGDGDLCRETGVAAYVVKPVSRFELMETAAAALADTAEDMAARPLITRHSLQESRLYLHVLIADDNPVNQEIAATMLRGRGHRVSIVANGREAIEAVKKDNFDLVLMDVQMPELDGLAATREIRRTPGVEDLPIVAVTAHELRDRCLEAGMNGFLPKPFKPHELFAIVEGVAFGDSVEQQSKAVDVSPPVDLERFKKSMRDAGAEEGIGTVLGIFLRDAPGRLASLEVAIHAKIAADINSVAHGYKASAATVGANTLSGILRNIELAGIADDVDTAISLFESARVEHDAVLAYLQNAVQD
jgi:signal transduction histidine kinase/CheY-like chemotaxis protein